MKDITSFSFTRRVDATFPETDGTEAVELSGMLAPLGSFIEEWEGDGLKICVDPHTPAEQTVMYFQAIRAGKCGSPALQAVISCYEFPPTQG